MKPMNFPRRREARRKEAEDRQLLAAQRDPANQLRRLDELLGKGKGAKKERARLKKAM